MGKGKKKPGRTASKHSPLEVQMDDDTGVVTVRRKAKAPKKSHSAAVSAAAAADPAAVPKDLSERILKEARLQRAEMEMEMEAGVGAGAGAGAGAAGGAVPDRAVTFAADGSDSDADSEYSADEDNDDVRFAADGFVEAKMDPEDEALLARFMAPQTEARRTLGDLIMEQINLAEQRKAEPVVPDAAPKTKVSPKIVQVYTQVGTYLRRYKSGKLPRVFKMLPGLQNWEELLYLTSPETWTPHAVFAATRIFASNLNPAMAQRYYAMVLLPAARDDIHENKRLNYHLYMALRKACYKPAAFFKGIVIPLCEDPTSTLREAVIVASICKKASLPQLHSAAAIVRIASSDYSAATSILLDALLAKGYALPYRVLDAVVAHFVRFKADHNRLPLVWHRCLLCFVTRYKAHVTDAQVASLRSVMRVHTHPSGITEAIRRELLRPKAPPPK